MGEFSLPSIYQIMTVDVHGGENTLIEESGQNRVLLGWLPDNRIAFYASGDLQEGIWLKRSDGSGSSEFFLDSVQAIWSPDGNQVAFEKIERGAQVNTLSILVRDLSGGNEQEVYKTEQADNELWLLQWSPDGKRILFSVLDGTNARDDLVVLTPITMEAKPLIQGGYFGSAAWSPDGELIAYTYQRLLVGGNPETLFVMKSDGSCPVQLVQPSGDGIHWASWSPDGKRIAFSWNNGVYMLDTAKAQGMELFEKGSTCP